MNRRKGPDYDISAGYRLGWAIMLLHHLLAIATGLIGLLGKPSPAVIHILGDEPAVYLWSAGFVAFGSIALIARLRRRILTEVTAVVAIAAFRALWAVMILFTVPDSQQLAISLIAGGVFMLGWSITSVAFLRSRGLGITFKTPIEELRDQLREHLDQEGAA